MKHIQNDKGVALITVLLTFLVLVILIGALVMSSLANQNTTLKANNYSKSYYIAETGLNLRSAQISEIFYELVDENPDPNDLFINFEQAISLLPNVISYPSTDDDDFSTLSFVPSETNYDYPDYLFYTLSSTGSVNGITRTLTKEFGYHYTKSGPGLIIGKAVLTQRSMSIGEQGSIIIGAIASNLLDGTQINLNNTTQNDIDMVFVPTGRTSSVINPTKVNNRITEVSSPFIFPTIVYPTIPSTTPITISPYTFSNNKASINVYQYSYLENLSVADGQILTVNLGTRGTANSRKILRVKNMNVSGGIRILGTGRLLLIYDYGTGTMSLGPKFNVCGNVVGSCLDENPDYTKFLFYLKTSNVTSGNIAAYPKLVFENQHIFYGSILGEFVNIGIKSGNFKGHIVTSGKTIEFTSNSVIHEVLFYAPFADITISSNAVLSGSLVGNTFSISNPQTRVTYVEVDKESFPFTIDFPVTETSDYVPGIAEIIEGRVIGN
jgi:hypothetical protein